MASEIKLYPHEPASLLPLLKSHLPNSLPVYGCILSNPSSPHTTTSTSPGSTLSHAYATFPPTSLPNPPTPFVILIHLPPPMSWQVRLFCSSETTSPLSSPDHLQALELVKAAVSADLAGPEEETRMFGGMSTLWCDGVRELLGTRENETCDVWLAPEGGEMGEGEVDKEGLRVDVGRREDCEMIKSTRFPPAPLDYYIARLPYTTAIRPHPTPSQPHPAAVAWILTHSDGDQGALYTLPAFRRRGLARWVTRERLREAARSGIRGFVFVYEGNEVSGRMWERMGWMKGWRAQWVYVRDDVYSGEGD